MNLFDELFSKAKEVANIAGKKTGEVVEVGKLKLQAVQLGSEIDDAYKRLGGIYYEQKKTGTDNSDLIDVIIAEIDTLQVTLAEYEEKLAEARNTVKCHNCAASNEPGAAFCSRCGSSLAPQQYGAETVIDVEPTPVEPNDEPPAEQPPEGE